MFTIMYMILGACAGFFGGLLGIGGGLIIVPLLTVLFTSAGFPIMDIPRLAIGTSHATIIFVALSAVFAQYRKKAIDYSLYMKVLPAILLGTFIGSYAIQYASALVLYSIFCMVLAVGILFLFFNITSTSSKPYTMWNMLLPITGICALSATAGIGGGGLYTAYFLWRGLPVYTSIALSIASILPTSIFTTIYMVFASTSVPIEYAVGFVYLPAFVAMILPAVIFAQFGVRVGRMISTKHLRYIFSLFLLGVEIYMIYKLYV